MSELIKAYYQEHKAVFDEKFNQVLEGFNADAIHKMRTSTKRLRALFQLIQVLSGNKFKAKKQLRKVRGLFKYVGKIREIQIEQMLIWSYEEKLNSNYSDYIEYILKRENREIVIFLNYLSTQNKEDKLLNDDKILNSIENLKENKIVKRTEKYLARQTARLSEIISQRPNNKRIHEVRTILKQLYYLHDILTGILGREKLLKVSKERLKEIEQHLGTWHDLVNSPKYMNAWLRTQNTDKSEKYITLKRQIQEDTKSMRMEIIRNIYTELIS
jgi:CHAD domain-containing protein